MRKITIDNIVLDNFSLNIDPSFGSMEFADNPAQKDTGLFIAKFEIDGARVEYKEWYSVENSTIEQTDTMHPSCTSTLAERLDIIIDKLQEKDCAFDFYSELDSYIESEIARLGK